MPPSALALLLTAAVLHASWNLLVKQSRAKEVFTWLSLIVGSLCFLPVLLRSPALPARAWPYLVVSAAAETAYFFALTRAYSLGDFSLVYPLARGTAPALLALWSALFLGERPTPFGLLGLLVLIGGLLVVGSGAWWRQRDQLHLVSKGTGAALLVALCISIYSAIDGKAVKFASPITYSVLLLGLSAVMCTPVVLARFGRQTVAGEWRANWPRIVVVGLLNIGTYMLVLLAYSRAHVSYAGAIREISVVFAALIGWRWLGESFGLNRTAGALLIFAGIVIIAALG